MKETKETDDLLVLRYRNQCCVTVNHLVFNLVNIFPSLLIGFTETDLTCNIAQYQTPITTVNIWIWLKILLLNCHIPQKILLTKIILTIFVFNPLNSRSTGNGTNSQDNRPFTVPVLGRQLKSDIRPDPAGFPPSLKAGYRMFGEAGYRYRIPRPNFLLRIVRTYIIRNKQEASCNKSWLSKLYPSILLSS
jgi:hypothetical protein